ncbi:hypothetical protein GBAR_LOCUS21168 [Geodia barretti]|uniref:Fibronectin type-III domain-containing protein n=1 Tax=Geodia barretti TaxID=519541 RepID=A0AA35SYE5_GEOBA|nr:hypothetical protein GBAR_LOCUS21168 [Geodia barretti]
MATVRFFPIAFLMVLSPPEGIVVNCDTDNCDMSGNVSLSSSREFCPSQPVTVQCNVTKPQDGAQFLLSWECKNALGMNTERLVFCDPGPVAEISCQFGEVYDVKGDCICDETVIKSEATFNTTSMCDMKLFCSNGGAERQHVSVTIDGLNAPVLLDNYTMLKMDNGTYEVKVWWTKGNCAPDDVEYNLTLTNTSSEEAVNNYVTKQSQQTLYLNPGIEYVIAVTAQLCDGDLKSETSNKLTLYIPGTTTITPGTTMTSNPAESNNTAAIVGSTISVIVLLLLLGVVVFFIWYFRIWRKKGREGVC